VRGEPLADTTAATTVHSIRRIWPKARVLIADDQAVNRLVLTGMLRRHDITSEQVDGGAAALAAARRQDWDLLLIDVQMPEVDGFQVVENLRATGFTTPVIAVTAHAMAGDRDECLRRGFSDHLAKPVRPDELARVLERWLSSPIEAPAVASAPHRSAALAALAEAVGDACMRQAVAMFRSESQRLVAEAVAAVQQGDLHTAMKRGHTLKGDAGNFGLDELVAAASSLEQAAKSGDTATCQAIAAQLPALWRAADGWLAGQD
jgi:CheY-like chemotaxis protein